MASRRSASGSSPLPEQPHADAQQPILEILDKLADEPASEESWIACLIVKQTWDDLLRFGESAIDSAFGSLKGQDSDLALSRPGPGMPANPGRPFTLVFASVTAVFRSRAKFCDETLECASTRN